LFDLSHHPFFLHQFTQMMEMKLFQKILHPSLHPFIHSSLQKLLHSSLHPFMWLFSSVHHRRPPAAEIIERRLFFNKQIFIHPFAPFNSFIHSIHFIRCFSFLIPSSFTSRLRREELSQGRADATETQQQGPSSAAVPLSARLLCTTTTITTVHDPMSFSRTSQAHAFHARLSSWVFFFFFFLCRCPLLSSSELFFSSYLAAHFTKSLIHP
jgi:hypothetical protein